MLALRRSETLWATRMQRNPFVRDVLGELLVRSRRRDAVGRELRANRSGGIPTTCSRHPDEVIGLVVRGLGEGRIELESHAPGGCALTVDATLLFDVLGQTTIR